MKHNLIGLLNQTTKIIKKTRYRVENRLIFQIHNKKTVGKKNEIAGTGNSQLHQTQKGRQGERERERKMGRRRKTKKRVLTSNPEITPNGSKTGNGVIAVPGLFRSIPD